MTRPLSKSVVPHAALVEGTMPATPKGIVAPQPCFDVQRIREDFPILKTQAHGKPLVYLDNAATTQKPRAVTDTLKRYYEAENANIHRGVYALSQLATTRYEEARKKVQQFINAKESREIIFTRGTTESINLVANSYGRTHFKPGDEIILTGMEHHSNIVPWQMICQQTGAVIRVLPFDEHGELMMDELAKLLGPHTKFVSVVHVSNSLGTINPVKRIIDLAHAHGVPVLVDGAQWVAHGRTDVQALDCDFYAFSGHKMLGPTGIGVLYGKAAVLEAMPPFQGGGDMIETVTFEKTTYAQLPNKFEAGTPNIAGAVGLGAAIDYLEAIGLERLASHERQLLDYATRRLCEVPGLRLVGTAKRKAGVVSFVMDDPPISSMDLGTRLDSAGIAVRTGHHCCQPVMDHFQIPGTTRASFSLYNTKQDVDSLVEALKRIVAEAKDKIASRRAAPAEEPTLAWPEAVASSPQAAADELAEVFDMLDDRDAKNQYVLELGDHLPHTFDMLKRITERVPGCMSEVYVIGRHAPGEPDELQFLADANADIVRGLIALMQRIYSGQRASEILSFDVEAFFHRIGLDQFISSQRRNGLQGMVRRIRALASGLAS
ncbi:MAG: SufS family cysteine desulfurase [Bacillota bacterium]